MKKSDVKVIREIIEIDMNVCYAPPYSYEDVVGCRVDIDYTLCALINNGYMLEGHVGDVHVDKDQLVAEVNVTPFLSDDPLNSMPAVIVCRTSRKEDPNVAFDNAMKGV